MEVQGILHSVITDCLFPYSWRTPEAEGCCPLEPVSSDCVPAANTLGCYELRSPPPSVLPAPYFLPSLPLLPLLLPGPICVVPALGLCPAFNLALVEILCRALPVPCSPNGMHSFPGYKDSSGPAPRHPLLVATNTGAISLSSETGAQAALDAINKTGSWEDCWPWVTSSGEQEVSPSWSVGAAGHSSDPPPCTSDDCEMCPESLLLLLSRRRALKQREGKLHPGAAHLSHVQRGHLTLLLKCEKC